MKTAPVTPFLLPAESCVSVGPWSAPDGSEVTERLEHWDPFTQVELGAIVTVDLDALRVACELPEDSSFAIVARWSSTRTRLTDIGEALEFGTAAGVVRGPLEIRIPGSAAGGTLRLDVVLVLRTPGSVESPIAPQRPGTILWRDRSQLRLEGSSARFPVSAVSFESVARLPNGAGWVLDWDPEDLEGPFNGALRLLVNSDNESLVGALRTGGGDQAGIRGFVMYDVTRAMVFGALTSEAFVDNPDAFPEDSTGRMLRELLASLWPATPILALRQKLASQPGRLDAELQESLGVLS